MLERHLINAVYWGALGTLFTRNIFFTPALILLVWNIIIAPAYYADNIEVAFVWIPVGSVFGVLIGVATLYITGIGQLINALFQGGIGGDQSTVQYAPALFTIIAFGIVTLVYGIVIALDTPFMSPIAIASGWAIALAILGGLLALIALVVYVYYPSTVSVRDARISALYLACGIVLAAVPPVLYAHIVDDLLALWMAVVGLFVLLTIFALIAYGVESSADEATRGLFFDKFGTTVGRVVWRAIVLFLVLAAIYIIGGYVLHGGASAGGVIEGIWWLTLSLLIVASIVYCVYAVTSDRAPQPDGPMMRAQFSKLA